MAHLGTTRTEEKITAPDIERWLGSRSYRAQGISPDELLTIKADLSVSVILPARRVASTIGPILDQTMPLRSAGLLDEVVVIDAASEDGTGALASKAGATVHQRDDILTHHGPNLGKGDALWRGLAVTSGDIVIFLDTDTKNFDPSFVLGLLRPLLLDPDLHLVKGAFARPLTFDGFGAEDEGGRVTELVARPLINLFFPELAGFRQPLAGEIAARRSLLASLPFPVGYGVEIAMLIDSLAAVGLDALGQVDLGRRVDSSKHLRDLTPMASSVLAAALRRAGVDLERWDGQIRTVGPAGVMAQPIPEVERPPLSTLPS